MNNGRFVQTNPDGRRGGIEEALRGADVCVAFGRRHHQAGMGNGYGARCHRVCLPNPVPEIWPWEAKEAGARIVATGRSATSPIR